MIVATAGHIDHGKTTLVRALTGIDTDRLPEEKARGISIDIGFAHCTLPSGETLGFVDVPGHERFVRNMLSGVYAVDHVLLVVAADDGVMPQTREHLGIVALLGVRDGTVVITKGDRVSPERVAAVEAQVRALVRGTAFAASPVMPVSAPTGAGVPALRERLASAARTVQARHTAQELTPRFVVDRVFTAQGSGTIATGTVVAGVIGAGYELVISPAGIQARVRKLQRHGEGVQQARAGERCAINLAHVEQTALSRGDWLVAPAAHHPTSVLDVRVKVLDTEAGPLRHWTPVHVHIGAADVPARLAMRRGAAIAAGEDALARLRLERPVNAVHGDRFILRDQSASRTVAGGSVVDPQPDVRRPRPLHAQVLQALEAPTAPEALSQLLRTGERRADLDWFARVFGWPVQRVEAAVPADAVRVAAGSRLALDACWVDELHQRMMQRLRDFHRDHPDASGIELEEMRRAIERGLPPEAFLLLVRQLAVRGEFELRHTKLRLAGHDSTDNPRDTLAWQRIRPMLQDAGAAIPSVRELSTLSRLPLQPLRDLMHRKCAAGALVRLTAERFALPETLHMLARKAAETAEQQADGRFTAAQFRDTIGTGRGLAIEILECMDRRGLTRRRGDNSRVLV